MKAFVTLCLLLLSTTDVFSQSIAPLGKMLERVYPTMTDQSEEIVWVYFTDKGPGIAGALALPPETFVSARSVQRRMKVLDPARLISEEDLPLHHDYVATIETLVKKVRHEMKWFNAVSVVAAREQINLLRELPFVREVELVGKFKAPDLSVDRGQTNDPGGPPSGLNPLYLYGNSLTQNAQINTVAVHDSGITGQGVLIGIFDAGFSNLTHPALATRPIVARYDFVANSTTLGNHSHGQNTFSVIGGFVDGTLIGPAFGASFVLARTEDANTETPIEEDNWARAIVWADSIGIDVASTSLGYITMDPPWPGYTWQDMDGATTVITRAADRASDMGIVVVNSAGNEGSDPTRNTLGAPSDGFNVIAAGAVTSSGTRSSFSSVGNTIDGRIKPDVMAMGSSVYAASGATGYTFVDGTSFSCPLSAGVAALVVSANPGLTPAQVREAMRQTASRATTPDRFYGWGILNALNAVNYAWISHTPLGNTEDTTARTLVARVRSRISLVADSTRVVYGINGTFTGSSILTPTGNPGEYSAQIPFLGSGALVTYYITAKNARVSTRAPLTGSYAYQVGTDLIGPAITHRSLGNQSLPAWPPRITAAVTDASGIDTVIIESRLNGSPLPSFGLPLVDGVYTDTLHIAGSGVQQGDSISYRIVARDRAGIQNVTTYPPSGFITFAALDYFNLNSTFDESSANFFATNNWQWGVPSGTSPPAHSGLRCWATVLNGNYSQGPLLSSLTTPRARVFSNRASFSIWQWQEIQSRYDGGNVKIAVNGGPFLLIHPVESYPQLAIYNGFGNPLGGQSGYSGVEGTTWSRATFDLTSIAAEGDSIALRFDFGADNSLQYRGWYIDDFTSDGIVGQPPSSNPILGVDRDTVNFGNVAIGETDSSQSIVVSNNGQSTLIVSNISSSDSLFGVSRTSFSLGYLDTTRITLYFTAPAPGGLRTGTLTFTSNGDPPVPTVQMLATSVGQPGIVVAPDTFHFALTPGPDTTRATFRISNPGTDTLVFSINEGLSGSLISPPVLRSTTQQPVRNIAKNQIDPSPGEGGIDGQGGPDAFGYRWIDSDEPGGPAYNWVEIRGVGTQITGLEDDSNVGPFPIGFTFPFYGNNYTDFRVCSNGWISFTSLFTSYINGPIPSTAEPNNALYAFWDDLNFNEAGGTAWYRYDAANSRLIIQFDSVSHYTGAGELGNYTFQILLYRDGRIIYQYQRMTGTLNSATIGSENSGGIIALQVVNNAAYVHDNLAILLTRDIIPWMSSGAATGTIAPGDSQDVEIRIHPAGMQNGTYTGRLIVTGNTPDIGTIRVGLTISTVGVEESQSGIPTAFALSQNYPNPFNPTTLIRYALPVEATVVLRVFNMLGQEVATVVNGAQEAGVHDAVWNGRHTGGMQLGTGVYFYRLHANAVDGRTYTSVRKMVLIK